MKKVAIIGGHDMGKTTLSKMLVNNLKNESVVVVHRESLQNTDSLETYYDSTQFSDPMPYVAAPRFDLYGSKEFICKGKHQYREVKETNEDNITSINWVCQCGRNMKD